MSNKKSVTDAVDKAEHRRHSKKLKQRLNITSGQRLFIFLSAIAITLISFLYAGLYNDKHGGKAAPGDWAWQRATNDSDQANIWASISSSDDGMKLIAATRQNGAGSIFTSINGGMNWTKRDEAGSGYWSGVSSSDDGTKLIAAASSGYIYTSPDSGETWLQRTSAGSRGWNSVTSSSDGMKLVATVGNGYIYTSSDSGATWTEQTASGIKDWTSVTSSSDGMKLVATVGNGYIYTSSDSGATWTEQTSSGSRSWTSVDSSADGMKLVATTYQGYIYSSADSGNTWTQLSAAGSRQWTSVTSSNDGVNLFATSGSIMSKGYIFTSSDSGSTWTQQTSAGYRSWSAIASSDDGGKISAVEYGGFINVSSDSGVTWQQIEGTGSRRWISTASSEDGSKLVAASVSYPDGDYIYTSSDYGRNWTQQINSGSRMWASVTSSSDGTKLVAATTNQFGDYLFASSDSGVNWTQLTSAGSRTWSSVASSSDGTKLVATAGSNSGDYIYASSDSGTTWTARSSAGSRQWISVSSSPDGTMLAAVANNGYIYTSSDSGATWTARSSAGSRQWQDVDLSDDGVNIVAVVYGGYVYQSLDSGATWTQVSSIGSKSWASAIVSNDGSRLIVVAGGSSGEYVYTSIDHGANWTQQNTAGSRNWSSVASSYDGTRVLVSSINGPLYTGYLDGYAPPSSFIMTVKTNNPGSSSSNQYTIPTNNTYTYNYNVDCNNDGTPEYTNQTGDVTCTYGSAGEYDIAITGTFPHMMQSYSGDQQKITDVKQWGDIAWQDMSLMFSGATNITAFTATDVPDLSQVADMSLMFSGATNFNSNINNWNVGNVTDMDGLFGGSQNSPNVFNQPLGNWNTSNVNNMSRMFYSSLFNQNIDNWNVSNVTDMSEMFGQNEQFNQPLNNWDVSQVVNMRGMFGSDNIEIYTHFNQPLNNWDVSSVTSMEYMFANATDFNQNINDWDVSNVVDMEGTFAWARAFNQPLNYWNTSNVTDMSQMFMGASGFDQPLNSGSLSNWDVSSNTNFLMMFMGASSFNQPLNNWDTSNVQSMQLMFSSADSFNQSLANWDLTGVDKASFMFGDTVESYKISMEEYIGRPFAQWTQQEKDDFYRNVSNYTGFPVNENYVPNPSGLSTANYDATLIGWSAQTLLNDIQFDAGTSKYCTSETQRQSIITNFSWTINDMGKDCSPPLGIPQNLTGIPHSTSIEVDWDDVAGADHYIVQYKPVDGSWITYSDNTVTGSYLEITGLTPSTFYNFRIRAVDDANNHSDWSNILTVKTLALQTYHITNCQQLQSIAINPVTFEFGDTTASYVLDNDIDCSESANWTWEGISELESPGGGFIGILDIPNSQPFTGTFDGQGYTISNLTQDFVPTGGGVFAWTQGSELKDVIISNSYVNNPGASLFSGGFAGRVVDTIISNVHVKQLNMSNKLHASGGLVAAAEGSTIITRSSAEGVMHIQSVSNRSDDVVTGGLVGVVGFGMVPTSIDRSYADVDIDITLTDHGWPVGLMAGGLTGGSAYGVGILEDTYSLGSIAINMTNTINDNGIFAGGLAGNAVLASDSYSATPISIESNGFSGGGGIGVGGLLGIMPIHVVNSFAVGAIDTDDPSLTPGGLVGVVYGQPEDIPAIFDNNYYDQTTTGLTNCVNRFIDIDNDTDITPTPVVDCTSVNPTNNDPNYFINNHTNPPLNTWNFSNIWVAHTDRYPDFIADTITTAPSVPLSPSISNITTTSMQLNWLPPSSDGGSPITSYQVQYKTSSSNTWISAPLQGSSPTSHVLTNLTPNTSYDFRVAAINIVGTSPYTNPVSGTTLTPSTPPPPPPPPTPTTTPDPPVVDPEVPTTDTRTNTPVPGTPVYKPKPSATPAPQRVQDGSGSFTEKLRGYIGAVGPSASYAPASLLILLVALAIFYLYQTWREQQVYNQLDKLLRRYRVSKQLRADFVNLSSHYLNTPLQIMRGSLELAQTALPHMAHEIKVIGASLEIMSHDTASLLQANQDSTEASAGLVQLDKQDLPHLMRRTGVWLPVVSTVALMLIFEIVILVVGRMGLNPYTVGVFICLTIFAGLMVLFTYRARWRLRSLNKQAQATLSFERNIDSQRVSFMETTTKELNDQIDAMRLPAEKLLATGQVPTFANGYAMLGQVAAKLSQITTVGQVSAETALTPLKPWLESHLPVMTEYVESQGMKFNSKIEPNLAVNLTREALAQIVSSLIGNAVKFSKAGAEIGLTIAAQGDMIHLAVQDTGVGIAKDKLAQLMQPFARGTDVLAYDYEGIGLSLYLDRLIVERVGGELTMQSVVGKGTTVSLLLPRAGK